MSDYQLEAIEWFLITRNVCGGGDGKEHTLVFQEEFLTARIKLFESIRVLLQTSKVSGGPH